MAAKRRIDTMEENRRKLLAAARKAFASKGFAASSMDELTADAGLTRGALYHNFGDKTGLLGAVVAEIDGEMAERAKQAGALAGDGWEGLLAEGAAYIEMALNPEVRRVVLLDGPAFLGDPSRWPSQNACPGRHEAGGGGAGVRRRHETGRRRGRRAPAERSGLECRAVGRVQ